MRYKVAMSFSTSCVCAIPKPKKKQKKTRIARKSRLLITPTIKHPNL